jgi:hypothetical protein
MGPRLDSEVIALGFHPELGFKRSGPLIGQVQAADEGTNAADRGSEVRREVELPRRPELVGLHKAVDELLEVLGRQPVKLTPQGIEAVAQWATPKIRPVEAEAPVSGYVIEGILKAGRERHAQRGRALVLSGLAKPGESAVLLDEIANVLCDKPVD